MIGVLVASAIVITGVAGVAGGVAWSRARSRSTDDRGPSAAPQQDTQSDHPSAAPQTDGQGDLASSQRRSQRPEEKGPAEPAKLPSERSEAAPHNGSDPPTEQSLGTTQPANTQEPPPSAPSDEEGRDPAPSGDGDREPWIISGGVDGGGTNAVLDPPVVGWPSEVLELLKLRPQGTRVLAGVEVNVDRENGAVRISAPGRVLLHLHSDHARLTMPALAVERHGVAAWLDRWPAWASRLLLGRELTPQHLHAAGWRTGNLNVHVDTANVDLPDTWIVHPDAWTGRSVRQGPRPDGYDSRGRLTGLWLNSKADNSRDRKADAAMHAYNKSLEQRQSARPSVALAKLWSDAGYRPELHGDVFRWEACLSGNALRLRSGDDDGEQWNLQDPASWACSAAVTAAWAYIVGVPGKRTSGVIRLTDERERNKLAKRRNAHPIFEILRTAAASAPRRRITQVRAVVERERELRQERAESRVGRALGQLAGVVGAADTPQRAAGFARSVVPKITQREDWADHVSRGRVDHADLHELHAELDRPEHSHHETMANKK